MSWISKLVGRGKERQTEPETSTRAMSAQDESICGRCGALTRTNSFAALIISALALAGCSRSSSVIQNSTPTESMKVQVTQGQSTSDWKVNILEVAEPDTVKIQSQLSTSDEKPDQNKKWLMLTLDLTPPGANARLPIKQIQLVDESSVTQTPLSLTAKAAADAPRFTYFEESFGSNMLGGNRAGLGSVDKEGKLMWMYTQDGKSKEVVLTVMKAEPQKILFLFAVPATARKLTLQL